MKFQTRLWLLITLALLLVALMSFAVGKYMSTSTITGSVKFTAKLAESITITPMESVTLIPGDDTSATYIITINGRTKLPAQLMVTFENTADAAVAGTGHKLLVDFVSQEGFEISDDGTKCTYKIDLAADSAGGEEKIELTIPLKVSQYAKSNNITENNDADLLEVSAILAEKTP